MEAVAGRLVILQEGRVLTDGAPDPLLARAIGSVWTVTTDQAAALQLQASYQVSSMVNQLNGITLRIVSPTRPHEAAIAADPSLEEAYLVAVGSQAVPKAMGHWHKPIDAALAARLVSSGAVKSREPAQEPDCRSR